MKTQEPYQSFFSAGASPVPLPPMEDAWSDMRKRLDEEMPERILFFGLKRAALLLLLLLLPLRMLWLIEKRGEGIRSLSATAKPSTGSRTSAEFPASPESPTSPVSPIFQASSASGIRAGAVKPEKRPHRDEVLTNPTAQNNATSKSGATPGMMRTGKAMTSVRQKEAKKAVIDTRLPHIGSSDSIRVQVSAGIRMTGTVKMNANKTSRTKKIPVADSTRILWAAGLQDSKSFPIGTQQAYNYDANLKKDLWADYIPSPYYQYHLSRRIALQAAIQLNSPQYTESVTIFRKTADTATGALYVNDTSVTVKKLYYFNFPLTLFYSPFRNLSLGAGLQFSNLRNGIAFQNNVLHRVGSSTINDTVTTSERFNLKENRPAYNNLRKTDWRVLFETDYYWKRVTVGLQYQQALGNYIYKPVPGSGGKDRNRSFDIYLRYNIRERRTKITPH